MIGCPSLESWHSAVPTSSRGPKVFGLAILLVCLGGFAGWAALAPLDGAVVVSGTFVATGQNKQVQHLEGGIIRDVMVREGDVVSANQPLVRLDETAAQAKLRRLVVRRHRLWIMSARLDAEIKGEQAFAMPAILGADKDDPDVRAIYDRQVMELKARRMRLQNEEEVLRKEIAGLRESMAGYTVQLEATRNRLSLFNEELKDKSGLLARQLARKTEVLAIQRAEAGLSGEVGELQARIADARERTARAEQQIAQLRAAATHKSIEDIRSIETELDDINEQVLAAQDVVNRVEVRAPVGGIVVKLNHNTRGGVVAAGAVILELLPINDELVIEARLNPHEIAHVREGQNALVRLSALNQRLTPMVDGKVEYLSADTVSQYDARTRGQLDPAQQRGTYIVRVRLDEHDLKRKVQGVQLTPGMPADVFIRTGERTFLEYVMKPVYDSFSRAFRES